MADNVDSDDTVDLAFSKIERKRKKERAQKECFRRKQHELRKCQDLEDQREVGSDLLTIRMKTKAQQHCGREIHEHSHQGERRHKFRDIAASTMESSRAEDSLCGSDCDVNEEIDAAPMDIGSDGFDGEIHDDVKVIDVDLISTYVFELRSFEGICPVNQIFSAFCLLDIDIDKRILNERKFSIVQRKPVLFGGEIWNWVYQCNLCRHQADLSRMTSQIHLSYDDFERLQTPCHHCLAAAYVLTEFDNINNIEPSSYADTIASQFEGEIHCPVFTVPRNDDFVVVWDSAKDTYGVVTRCRSGIICRTCTTPSSCIHLRIIRLHEKCLTLPLAALSLMTESNKKEDFRHFKCLSTSKISFCGSKKGNTEITLLSREINGVIRMKNGDEYCERCSSIMQERLNSNREFIPLFMQTGIFKAHVSNHFCDNCKKETAYDGLNDEVLNMGNYLVTHGLLRNFMHHFLHGRMPMFTYHSVYRADMIEMGYDVHLLTYNKFKDSWYAFLDLLDVDFASGFSCEVCKDKPRVLIMDATALSFRKEMAITWNCFLAKTNTTDADVIPRVSAFSERLYVPDKRCRKLLRRYALSGRKKEGPLDYSTFNELLSYLQDHHSELYQLLCVVNSDCLPEDHSYLTGEKPKSTIPITYACPSVWQPTFRALSCATPICGLLHNDPRLHATVRRIAENIAHDHSQTEDDLATVKCNFPMLYELLMSFPDSKVPRQFSKVLEKLLSLSTAPFRTPSALPASLDLSGNPYGFWPSLPILRERGNYQIEQKKKQGDGFVCKKLSKDHSVLMPGVFTIFCEHEICYGFEVMLSNESPDVPFTVMFSRFQQAPEFCVYDNACNLHDYCLNRQPSFFANTKFLVDRLHWKNHTGCSDGYNMAKYPLLQQINSQINEQMNSCLKRIKPQLSYMKQQNFMSHCALYLWFRNKKTRTRKEDPSH